MNNNILVIGGGFSGVTAAVEAAEMGYNVIIVEKEHYLGGRVAQLNKYFPKMCPPTCGLEINFRRIKTNPNITFYTNSIVNSISGSAGNFNVEITVRPKYTTPQCTAACKGKEVATSEMPDEFNFGLNKRKPIYIPHPAAFPYQCVLDPSVINTDEGKKIQEALPPGHIDLNQKEEKISLNVGAIIVATGWRPYDATKMDRLGFGKYPNIITNMMMERMASPSGPSEGKIYRPSDNKPPKSVGFVQCAGSRDKDHLPYCSYICCLATLKHIQYLKEQDPDVEATVFYIDLRTPGLKYENFYKKTKSLPKVNFIKGKVADVKELPNGNIVLIAEDTIGGGKVEKEVELAVLATGMQPEGAVNPIPGIEYDKDGFVVPKPGIIPCGCAKKPSDVVTSAQNSTAAAILAIQSLK